MERDGINLWRQIGETLANEIGTGALAPGDKLPASTDLASRFGVNQHTVLRAISHLQAEGLVRVERGRGTFIADVVPYRMGRRTRFEENLKELNRAPSRQLLSLVEMPTPAAIAEGLGLKPNDPVTLASVLAIADDVPISLNQNYFANALLPGIADAYRVAAAQPVPDLATRTILAGLGIADFQRKTIRVRGRQAKAEEARHLRMSPQDSVFEVEVINVDAEGRRIVIGQTSFPLNRVEFVWNFDEAGE